MRSTVDSLLEKAEYSTGSYRESDYSSYIHSVGFEPSFRLDQGYHEDLALQDIRRKSSLHTAGFAHDALVGRDPAGNIFVS